MKAQTAHDSQTDETRLFLLWQYFQRHAERVRALQKSASIGSLAHGARGGSANRFGPVAACDGFKVGENFEAGVYGLRIELTGPKYILAEANRLAVLGKDTIVFWMIDGCNLPAKGVAANVDYCEMICHLTDSLSHEKATWSSAIATIG
jgi:hypothetical protein